MTEFGCYLVIVINLTFEARAHLANRLLLWRLFLLFAFLRFISKAIRQCKQQAFMLRFSFFKMFILLEGRHHLKKFTAKVGIFRIQCDAEGFRLRV